MRKEANKWQTERVGRYNHYRCVIGRQLHQQARCRRHSRISYRAKLIPNTIQPSDSSFSAAPCCATATVNSSRFYESNSAKLHYTDTGYGHVVQHHQRTSSQQFYNLLYNKFATSQCQSPTSRHVKMLGCGKFLSVVGEFVVHQVVELL